MTPNQLQKDIIPISNGKVNRPKRLPLSNN